jgi:hypothetical protein
METDPQTDLHRKNVRFGLLLFGVFWILFAGTAIVAFLYLHFD